MAARSPPQHATNEDEIREGDRNKLAAVGTSERKAALPPQIEDTARRQGAADTDEGEREERRR